MSQEPPSPKIPPFRFDGYLPEGVYISSETEVFFVSDLRSSGVDQCYACAGDDLGRSVGAIRLLVDGSSVTDKEGPQDIDTVILLPQDFYQQIEQEYEPTLELEEMLLTRRPEETFAAEDETDWLDGLRFSVRRVNPTVVERISGDTIMIINVEQYQKAQEELRQLEDRLHR